MLLRGAVRDVVKVNKQVNQIHAERAAEDAEKRLQRLKESGDVTDSGLGVQVGRLSDGMAFGEQSFLARRPTPSMATVRTAAYCQLMTLTHGDLAVVTSHYPTLSSAIEEYREEKAAQYAKQNTEATSKGRDRRCRSRSSFFQQTAPRSALLFRRSRTAGGVLGCSARSSRPSGSPDTASV